MEGYKNKVILWWCKELSTYLWSEGFGI